MSPTLQSAVRNTLVTAWFCAAGLAVGADLPTANLALQGTPAMKVKVCVFDPLGKNGPAYANAKEKPREVIEQPCLCLFGVTTPGVFWGSLSSDNVIDGSLARMLIFESENHYPDPQRAVREMARVVRPGGDGVVPHGQGARDEPPAQGGGFPRTNAENT